MEPSDQHAVRLAKLQELESRGHDPFPPNVERTHTAAEALAAEMGAEVVVCGRVVDQLKDFKKLVFCHLMDGTGQVQLAFRVDALGEEKFALFKDTVERADFLEARGPLFQTRTGETTVEVRDFRVIAKALRPLPEKWHGLQDVEKRYRQRYLDLIVNEDVRRAFVTRSKVVATIRRFLDARGFLEVETPILQPLYGGAAARPFETYHNVLERKLYLRIAIELYLKRLIVGGLDKVYEIGRNFRNEGIDWQHNPEFTMLETYEAYADYEDVMAMVEEMMRCVATEALGSLTFKANGHEIDLGQPFRRVTMRDAFMEYARVDIADPDLARKAPIRVEPGWNRGKILDEILSELVQPRFIQPTFLTDYAVEFPGSTLAKRKPDDPSVVERFEGFIAGVEFCNAFSELNDPRDQRARFEEQVEARREGDEDAHPMDEDFLTALEHGMPPTGGLGIGIDRLVALLTDSHSLREVIFFPQLRTVD